MKPNSNFILWYTILDKRLDEEHEQQSFLSNAFLNLINISSRTTKSPLIPIATIEIPKVIGDREKNAHNKLQGINVN